MKMAMEDVRNLARAGRPFDEIERHIDERQLDSERKGALWLYAWAVLDHREQRRVARHYVAVVEQLVRDMEA